MVLASEVVEWGNIAVLIGTAIWAVSKIKSTTDKLAVSMDHLRGTVIKLDARFEHVTNELTLLRDRMTRIETVIEVGRAETRLQNSQ